MEDEFLNTIMLNESGSIVNSISYIGFIIGCIVLFCMLIISALISGSEVAFFSISPKNMKELKDRNTKRSKRVLELLEKPERLLATILITNNFVNVGIVILAASLTNPFFENLESQTLVFVLQAVVITFIILLIGEIIPKVYATQFSLRFASFMSLALKFLDWIFRPFSIILIKSTSVVNRRFAKKSNISIDDLSQALDIAGDELKEDEKILKGIINFGKTDVKEIMTSRVNVVGLELTMNFNKILAVILESGYSRIPVYIESFDQVKGILYIKDLLPFLSKGENFEWQSLIREPYFIPETKKIDDLLEEFQSKKIHMAIIIDEYGGTSGIVTLEDVLEEIVGEINDEWDSSDNKFQKLSENSYLFEGKTLLIDFYKITGVEDGTFEDSKGESDSLAGLILELNGEIPAKHEVFEHKNIKFKIKAVDNRRIKQIIVTIN